MEKIGDKMFKGDGSKEKIYQYLGVDDETAFKNKARQLKIPYLLKDNTMKSRPAGYKLNFLIHAGKLKS